MKALNSALTSVPDPSLSSALTRCPYIFPDVNFVITFIAVAPLSKSYTFCRACPANEEEPLEGREQCNTSVTIV
jgi:hypothetical protein